MARILEDVEKKLARLERNAEAIDRQLGLTDANRYAYDKEQYDNERQNGEHEESI